MRLNLLALASLFVVACSTEPTPTNADADTGRSDVADETGHDAAEVSSDVPTAVFDGSLAGPWTATVSFESLSYGERTIPVAVWGPSDASRGAVSISELIPNRADEYTALSELSSNGCATTELPVSPNRDLAPGAWPLVVYSHCHKCLGISGASVAAALASWGHVVIVPDHTGNTLWDGIDGTNVELGGEFLEVRGADVVTILDRALSAEAPFEALSEALDSSQVGLVGHSFGAVTVGWVAERDARVRAVAALAAPVENPLIPGVTAANIETPILFLVAVEDNSITEFGNVLMRQNFEGVAGPAVKLEVADAGHWSVSDMCGLTESFMPGCGEANRQTNGESFTYLPAEEGRALTSAWVTGFLGDELGSVSGAGAWMSDQSDERVSVETGGAE